MKIAERHEFKVDKIAVAVCPELELSRVNKSTKQEYPILPFTNKGKEEEFIRFVSDEQNQAIVVSFSPILDGGELTLQIFSFFIFFPQIHLLANHGHPTGKETINAIMRKLLTNKVASEYNFKGKTRSSEAPQEKSFERRSVL